jgi:deoxyribonuclease IV
MFGSHLSISGGMHNAVTEATSLGLGTVQVFTKNQQQWAVKPLEAEAIATWKSACKQAGYTQVVSHDSYLINLASPDPVLRKKSIALFDEELNRCDLLGIPYLVTHPGAHMGTRDDPADESAGLERIAEALQELIARHAKGKTIVCLEATAGQGSSLGHKLEHLQQIIKLCSKSKGLGVCLDTAHLFAAGYDFRGRKYAAFKKQLDATVGVDRVKVWHLNDSKKALGSRVDRHHHIGLGEIGLDGFRPIVRDKDWRDTPKILETAKETHESGRPWDAVNLDVLRGMMA